MLKNKLTLVFIAFILLVLTVSALSLSSNDKAKINICKKDCALSKKESLNSCHENYAQCLSICSSQENMSKTNKILCSKSCKSKRKVCIKLTNEEYAQCIKDCPYKALNTNVTCIKENQTYNAGEKFQNKCGLCRCNYDGNVKCEKLPNCGFSNFTISQNNCIDSNGLYQKLCNGPYFDLKCSSMNFCQCSGNNDYSCPSNTICIKNFTISDIPMTIPEWTDTSGNPLGDIGICANNQIIESCGNSICENKITIFNYIAENYLNCPQDCDNS